MYRQAFHLNVLLLLLLSANCFLHSVYEEFNTKQILFTNTNWKCSDQTTQTLEAFICSKGMGLVKLLQINQQCNKIYNIIDTKLPHFQIQLYIDVYGYSSIDGNESFFLAILELPFQYSFCLSTSLGKSLQQCSGYNNKQLIRKSFLKEISHSQEQVNFEIWSTTNQEFSDEAYLFRNVQLILDRCYKTCKTCSGQGKEQCLTCYNDISLSSSNSCDSCKDQTVQKFLQIPDGCKDKCDNNKDYDEDYVCIEDINLQDKCEDNCLKCTSTQSCLICKPQKYLYFGQCMDQCPEYTKIYGTNCLSIVDIISKNNNLRVKQLVREFYDLSTTKSSTDTIFQFISSSHSFNFQKGDAIYYSYFSNKRIFGGPLVWVNGAFKFTKNWTEEFQFIRIFFEVILGDIQLNNNIFTYKLNDQQLETITLKENYSGQNPNIQDQIWPNDYKFNIYQVDKSIHYQMSTNKQLTMEIKCQNNHELAFCGIQNMVVVGILNCEPEYYFDYYNYESDRNPCIPICGDKIIVGDEECDDGNNDPFDGCFNCKYQCEEHCDNCIYGYCLRKKTIYRQSSFKIEIEYNLAYYLDVISLSCIFKCSICINNLCLQCNYGYYLNTYNNLCETLCGDSINQGNEQCDDGNSDNYDGCSNCELIQYEKCDIEQDIQKYHCAVCYYGKCLKCNEGYILNDDLCISICGDGLINPIEEECDVQSGDGCIDCKIQNGYVCGKQDFSTCKTCDKECTQCVSLDRINLICKSCIDGYYNVEDKCLQCDSNCINCKLQSNLCTSCYRPDCDFCESIPGLFADIKTKQCNSICGDGILVESYEQCDDNNQNNGDGCDSQCNLEFSDNEINKMKYYLSQTNNTYDLKLNSEYQFKILCNTINIIIDNMDIQDYNYNCTQVDVLTCSLKFDFKKSIYKFNTIHAKLLYTNSINRILSENDRSILYDITPNEYIVLNNNEKSQQEYISSAQDSFSLIFLIMIPISIVLNLFNYLWAVLEILSWINNFYFLNVNYPFNVELFFLRSDWSNLIGFPTYQGLNQPDSNYYFEAPKRFKDKGIDPLFFNNIQVPFMFLLSSIIIFIINYLLYLFFSLLNDALKIKITIKKEKHFSIFNISIKKQNRQNSIKVNQQMTIQNPYLKYITNLLKQNSVHLLNQFKQTISLCLLDITLAILLQLSYSNNNSNIIVGLNQFFAIITIGIIIFQLFKQYSILNIHKLQAKNKHFVERYGIYYENINPENSFGYYYQFFGQINKIFYIFFMVTYYYTPLMQVTLCYISSSFCFVFLLYQNPYNSKKEYVMAIISNFCLSTIILITISFAINDEITVEFIEINKNILGWIIIALVLIAILIEFFVLAFGVLMYIFNIYSILLNQLRNYKKKKEQNDQNQVQQSQQKEKKFETTNKTTKQQSEFKSTNSNFSIVLF